MVRVGNVADQGGIEVPWRCGVPVGHALGVHVGAKRRLGVFVEEDPLGSVADTSTVANSQPVVRAIEREARRAIAIAGDPHEQEEIGQVLNVDLGLELRPLSIGQTVIFHEGPQRDPIVDRAIAGDDWPIGVGGIETHDIEVSFVAAEVLGRELIGYSLFEVIQTPVQTVQVDVNVLAFGVGLTHCTERVAAPDVADPGGLGASAFAGRGSVVPRP